MRIDSMNARLNFENAKALLQQNGLNPSAARLTQSYIRSEILINNTTAQYKLGVTVNQQNNAGTIYNTENRLALQDWFITSQIGVLLAVPSSSTDASYRLLSYPSPALFTTSGAAAAANTLYNGKLSLSIDQNVVLPSWDISRCYKAANTQAASNADYTTSGINYIDAFDFSVDGFYPVEGNLIINGAANIDFTLNLPAAIATVQSNSRIIVIQRGILAQNVTSVK